MGRVMLGIFWLGFLWVGTIHAGLSAHQTEQDALEVQKQRAEGVPNLVGTMWGRQVDGRVESEASEARIRDIQRSLEQIAADNAASAACAARSDSTVGGAAGPKNLEQLGDTGKSPVKGLSETLKGLNNRWETANKPAPSASSSASPNTAGASPPSPPADSAAAAAAVEKNKIVTEAKNFQTALAGHDAQIQNDLRNLCPEDVEAGGAEKLANGLDSYFTMRAKANKLLSSAGLLAGKKPGSPGGGPGEAGGGEENGGGNEKRPGMPMMGGFPGGMGGGGGQGSSSGSSGGSSKSGDSKPATMKTEGPKFGEIDTSTGFGALSSQVTSSIQNAWKSLSEKASASAKSWESFYKSLAVVPNAAPLVGTTMGAAPVASPSKTLTNSATANH